MNPLEVDDDLGRLILHGSFEGLLELRESPEVDLPGQRDQPRPVAELRCRQPRFQYGHVYAPSARERLAGAP